MGLFRFKYLILIGVFLIFLFLLNLTKAGAANAGPVALTTDVQPVIALALYNNSYDFGNLTPNTPKKGPENFVAGVTTNAENGYSLSAKDDVPAPNSCLLHTDGVTRIIDFNAPIAAPEAWNDGISKGLGFTVFGADTNKEAAWGAGITYDDALNRYAGVPQDSTAFHTSPAFKLGQDNSEISFALDVNGDQKTGTYAGTITISATAIL